MSNSLIPKDDDEIVVPVGRVRLITTKEDADKALEAYKNIFNEEEKMEETTSMNEELQSCLTTEAEGVETVTETVAEAETQEENEEGLVELSDSELAALPEAKYGRDKYGRSLKKNGEPRKGRNDKGATRASYNRSTSEE